MLEKVTLIKDIRLANPHRAHVEILYDLHMEELRSKHEFTSFQGLHDAWRKTLDTSELNKRFYKEIANWYFWALRHIRFPSGAPKESDGKDHVSVIRLITRLIFCWFIREKGLIPDSLFDRKTLDRVLTGFAPDSCKDKNSVYYRAVLQNLFFATLDTEMDKRDWATEGQHFMAHSLYRFRDSFREPDKALDLFKTIPFLNGGLFECLDKSVGTKEKPRYVRADGFSRRPDSQPTVPDFLFFGDEETVDLSEDYGDAKFKRAEVRGLFRTFEHYKFTVAENTPIEEEVALDPELSGQVFENLLAAYNPETGATARKQTGSFFTPREIVSYMADEALIACLTTKLEAALPGAKEVEARLRHLFSYTEEKHQFTPSETEVLIAAIDELKVLDPAVGSGAFPMGVLHKLVYVLGKLDPHNEQWKERQVARVRDAMVAVEKVEDSTIRERTLREMEQQVAGINEAFERNELDYGRKLYLIENCIYGVDIQPIAVQIAKMRFFISLVVDQKLDEAAPNRGIRPLPNLETKFVAANTLVGLPKQTSLRNEEIATLEKRLAEVRRRHFTARTPTTKRKLRDVDESLRADIAARLKAAGWKADTARMLAGWNPYDQNAHADFFDLEWMFGISGGVDVVIGNPPYASIRVMANSLGAVLREYLEATFECARGCYDMYVLFIEKGIELLRQEGVLGFIVPNKVATLDYAEQCRALLLRSTVLYITDVSNADVFESSSVYPYILLCRKSSPQQDHDVLVLHAASLDDLVARQPSRQQQSTLNAKTGFAVHGGLLLRGRGNTRPLSEVGRVHSGTTGFDAEAMAQRLVEYADRPKGSYFEFIVSRNIDRYSLTIGDVRYMKRTFTRPVLPASAHGVTEGKKKLYAGIKIVIAGMSKRIEAALDTSGLALGVSVYAVTDMKYDPLLLLGILNSRLMSHVFWSRYQAKHLAGGFLAINKGQLAELPIIVHPTEARRKRLIGLVDKLHDLQKQLPRAKTPSEQESAQRQIAATDEEIDRLVYDLYGLTEDEIAIVEGRT